MGEGIDVVCLPASLVADADIETMSHLPLIQDPSNRENAHPSLSQPKAINLGRLYKGKDIPESLELAQMKSQRCLTVCVRH